MEVKLKSLVRRLEKAREYALSLPGCEFEDDIVEVINEVIYFYKVQTGKDFPGI